MSDLFPATLPAHDPGGARTPLPKGVNASAVYGGPGDCYRYMLEWIWAPGPVLAVGMMNPSTASHLCGDRTVSWCHRWAMARGFGTLIVVNADAYRATDQARLAEIDDPMGPENAKYIRLASISADLVIVGYGQPKVRAVRDHGPRMARLLADGGASLHVWGLSKDGIPKHPLYLPAATNAVTWYGP